MQTPPMVQYMLQLHGARSRDAARKMLQLNGPPGEGGICPLPARAALNRSKALPMPSRMKSSAIVSSACVSVSGDAAPLTGPQVRAVSREGYEVTCKAK